MNYPQECPVFKVVGLPEYYNDDTIAVGTGFYSMGLDTIDPATGTITCFHADWLVPMTTAGMEMLATLSERMRRRR